MAEIVNIRQFSKQKKRELRSVEAAGNMAKHGRTKQQRLEEAAQANKLKTHLDGHKLDDL